MTTIDDILGEFRELAESKRDLGDRFERLILQYLRQDALYNQRFRDVWMWMDWPKRRGKADTGIDLVAQERATGDYCAVQCKFYHPGHYLDKGDIDSFFTASGKTGFTSRLIVSTTDKWTKHAEDALKDQNPPVTRLGVRDLDNSVIDWSQFSQKKGVIELQLKPKKTPKPHQEEAIARVMSGFETADRGKLIMACGTGKTFTGLKISESFVPHPLAPSPKVGEGGQDSCTDGVPTPLSPSGRGAGGEGKPARVLFLVPSIALLSQTLREWSAETAVKLQSIAVCSDVQASKEKRSADMEDMSPCKKFVNSLHLNLVSRKTLLDFSNCKI